MSAMKAAAHCPSSIDPFSLSGAESIFSYPFVKAPKK
jgi:hypothetical protein